MTKVEVEEILLAYKNTEARITVNHNVIHDIEEEYDRSLSSIVIDGLPGGKGGISRPVENMAFSMPNTVARQLENLKLEVKQYVKFYREVYKEISRLSYYQKYMINHFYILDENWVQIHLATGYSERQCKNIRSIALEILGVKFESNHELINLKENLL